MRQLREDLDRGQTTLQEVARDSLASSNSNAGRNVYISQDSAWIEREISRLAANRRTPNQQLLFGLPVSLKDCFDLAGFVTSCGSRFYAEKLDIPATDSAVAARLRSQGALITGKTNLHPLAYGITGENPDYGDCRQPGHPELLTGGSSSGGAASVMEGSALAAIGTDTGGSIRVPAALCGLAGFRASLELAHQCGLWRGGVHLSQSFDTLGWLFRDLRDGPLLAEALFGLRVPVWSGARVRIATVSADFLSDCDSTVMQAFEAWQQKLRDCGAVLSTFPASLWEGALDIYAPIQAREAAEIHALQTAGDFSPFEPVIADRLRWGQSLSEQEVGQARERHASFREKNDRVLQEYDFIAAPCAPVSRLLARADHSATRKAILRYTTPMSLAGAPVVTLPTSDGTGVQLIAARGTDAHLLSYSAALGELV